MRIFVSKWFAASPEAPFNEKGRLGSSTTIRGLPLNRYMANQTFVFRNELRTISIKTQLGGRPLRLGHGVFVEAGRVGDNFQRLVDKTMTHWSAGLSLFASYFTNDFVGCADLGFSEGNTSFYFRIGQSF